MRCMLLWPKWTEEEFPPKIKRSKTQHNTTEKFPKTLCGRWFILLLLLLILLLIREREDVYDVWKANAKWDATNFNFFFFSSFYYSLPARLSSSSTLFCYICRLTSFYFINNFFWCYWRWTLGEKCQWLLIEINRS